ncbi:MAG: diaminobutyrate acetyltransferase [Nitrospinota bacterium]|nr:diaminobutyrate acetyltransferase [Nitrospinota bacterium]
MMIGGNGSKIGAFKFRTPERKDGSALYRLIRDCPPLDVNSIYAYCLLADHFAKTVVLAEYENGLAGAVTAYIRPENPDTLFVWQIAVVADARRAGLGKKMLHGLMERPVCSGVKYMETTISPSNEASKNLFISLAQQLKCGIETRPFLSVADFAEGVHEEEHLYRIGPFGPANYLHGK